MATSKPPRTVLYLDHTAKWSGGEIALLRTLEAIDRTKVRAIVLLAADGPFADRLRERNIETHILPLSEEMREVRKDSLGGGGIPGKLRAAFSFTRYAFQVAKFARDVNADILHCNSLKADIYGALAGKLVGVPVIWHVRDQIHPTYLPEMVVRIFRVLAQRIPQYVITNSESTRQTLFPNGVGKQRTQAIHDGLSPHEFENPPVNLHSDREKRLPRIGIVGRLVKWKGQHIFLEAAHQLTKKGLSADFVIIGGPMFQELDYLSSLQHQADRIREIGGQVTFLGFQTNIPQELRRLDIAVHASITPEPFGQVIIEAMAEGVPVIGTNGGGVPEIIESGKTGLLTPMGDALALSDAISFLLDNPDEAARMSVAAYNDVRIRFTAGQNARKIENVYEEIIP